jgi:hypothetical protein
MTSRGDSKLVGWYACSLPLRMLRVNEVYQVGLPGVTLNERPVWRP